MRFFTSCHNTEDLNKLQNLENPLRPKKYIRFKVIVYTAKIKYDSKNNTKLHGQKIIRR